MGDGGAFAGGVTLRVTKTSLRRVLVCERHLVACLATPDSRTPELVAGRLADQLFGLFATGQPVGPDLVAEALGVAAAAGDTALGSDWDSLSAGERSESAAIVAACFAAPAAWPVFPGSALIRLQEPIRVELAGGRVVLSGRVDLMLGQPGIGLAGSTLVDVKSGMRRHDDTADAGWYAVLETVRHRAAPFQVGSFYLRESALSLEVVTPELLARATARIAEGIRRLVRLAHGAVPATAPNPLCPWCPAIGSCGPGRRFSADRGDLVAPVGLDDEDPDGH